MWWLKTLLPSIFGENSAGKGEYFPSLFPLLGVMRKWLQKAAVWLFEMGTVKMQGLSSSAFSYEEECWGGSTGTLPALWLLWPQTDVVHLLSAAASSSSVRKQPALPAEQSSFCNVNPEGCETLAPKNSSILLWGFRQAAQSPEA